MASCDNSTPQIQCLSPIHSDTQDEIEEGSENRQVQRLMQKRKSSYSSLEDQDFEAYAPMKGSFMDLIEKACKSIEYEQAQYDIFSETKEQIEEQMKLELKRTETSKQRQKHEFLLYKESNEYVIDCGKRQACCECSCHQADGMSYKQTSISQGEHISQNPDGMKNSKLHKQRLSYVETKKPPAKSEISINLLEPKNVVHTRNEQNSSQANLGQKSQGSVGSTKPISLLEYRKRLKQKEEQKNKPI